MIEVKEKIKEVEVRNAKTNEEIKALGEKRADLDRQIAGLRDEAIRQQGEYRALQTLIEVKEETVN